MLFYKCSVVYVCCHEIIATIQFVLLRSLLHYCRLDRYEYLDPCYSSYHQFWAILSYFSTEINDSDTMTTHCSLTTIFYIERPHEPVRLTLNQTYLSAYKDLCFSQSPHYFISITCINWSALMNSVGCQWTCDRFGTRSGLMTNFRELTT